MRNFGSGARDTLSKDPREKEVRELGQRVNNDNETGNLSAPNL